MTAAVALKLLPDPVAPADITSRGDRFACTPYRSVVTADCCSRRRALVRAGIRKLDFLSCDDSCPIGKVVEHNSGGPMRVNARLTESAAHTGGHYKLAQAVQFGQVFEGDEKNAAEMAAMRLERRRAQQREYRREKASEKLAKAAEGKG